VTDAERIRGTWVRTGEEVRTAEFHADGTRTYTIDFNERSLVMEMIWRIEDGLMVIDHPPAAGEERSSYRLVDNDTLVMDSGGELFTYLRSNSP
jgi:hypothetical protein